MVPLPVASTDRSAKNFYTSEFTRLHEHGMKPFAYRIAAGDCPRTSANTRSQGCAARARHVVVIGLTIAPWAPATSQAP